MVKLLIGNFWFVILLVLVLLVVFFLMFIVNMIGFSFIIFDGFGFVNFVVFFEVEY